jgi:adenine phosphoribosyltransferase
MNMKIESRIKQAVNEVPDFPKKGINFKDITPLFLDHQLAADIIDVLVSRCEGLSLTAVVGIESRGFLFGFALAQRLKLPFVLVRKKGKLPAATFSVEYDLEYGAATLEIHQGALGSQDKVLIHDDLLATGGTAVATAKLAELSGASIAGFSFVINLEFLNGSTKISHFNENIINLASY